MFHVVNVVTLLNYSSIGHSAYFQYAYFFFFAVVNNDSVNVLSICILMCWDFFLSIKDAIIRSLDILNLFF